MDASRLVWVDCGKQRPTQKVSRANGLCYWCGQSLGVDACRAADVCSKTFTDHEHARRPSSDWVCEGCSWVMSGAPPNTYRMWSVVYREDREAAPSHEKAAQSRVGPHTHLAGKNDLRELVQILLEPPQARWAVSVADSGQIHTLPFAPINRGDGYGVRFERVTVRTNAKTFGTVLHHVASLYAAGFSKEAIGTGDVNPSSMLANGIDVWRLHARALRPWRGSPICDLALFLTNKEMANDYALRTRGSVDGDCSRPGAVCDGVRVDEEDRCHRVVAAGEERPGDGGERGDELAAHGLGHVQEASNRNSDRQQRQLSLFD